MHITNLPCDISYTPGLVIHSRQIYVDWHLTEDPQSHQHHMAFGFICISRGSTNLQQILFLRDSSIILSIICHFSINLL